MSHKSRATLTNEAERILEKLGRTPSRSGRWYGLSDEVVTEMITDVLQASQKLDDERSAQRRKELEDLYNSPEATVDEHGYDQHVSWLSIRANRVTGGGVIGHRLFGSEINHNHYVVVTISRMLRKRDDLHSDFYMEGQKLMEISMSAAQWGAFVSSFGQGVGEQATLSWFDGEYMPREPYQASRLAITADEVANAAKDGLSVLQDALDKLAAAIKSGRIGEIKKAYSWLENRFENTPGNMRFAAKRLTEHTEAVITKARVDVEAMVRSAQQYAGLEMANPLAALEAGPISIDIRGEIEDAEVIDDG